MKMLAIDSSAVAASAAVMEDDGLKGEYYVNTRQTHSQTLMPMVESLLKNLGMTPAEIDLFAVSCGPGSFTGVRIGVSAVKGMALALGRSCAAVSSLEAAAQNAAGFDGIVCAVMDARRQQYYNALFEWRGGEMARLCEDRAVSHDDLVSEFKSSKKKIILVGDGAKICYNSLKGRPEFMLPPEHLIYQRASGVARVARRLYGAGEILDAGQLRPVYLRLPQAERELLARRNNLKGEL